MELSTIFAGIKAIPSLYDSYKQTMSKIETTLFPQNNVLMITNRDRLDNKIEKIVLFYDDENESKNYLITNLPEIKGFSKFRIDLGNLEGRLAGKGDKLNNSIIYFMDGKKVLRKKKGFLNCGFNFWKACTFLGLGKYVEKCVFGQKIANGFTLTEIR